MAKKATAATATPGRITYSALVNKIQSRNLTAREFGQYFTRTSSATPRFAPDLALNEQNVDVSGIEKAARAGASSLAFEATQVVRDNQLAAQGAPTPNGTMVAEGDSWFNLPEIGVPPIELVPPTLCDYLALKYPINNIAHWGDELKDMVTQAEYMQYLVTGKVKYLLFSGGGNDVLGDGHLVDFISQRQSGDNNVANIPNYILPPFFTALNGIEGLLRSMVKAVITASPSTKILIHGYDYVIPRRDGRWLGVPLAFRGFDPIGNKAMAGGVVKFFLDQFSARLDRIATDNPLNVRHVDLRGTVKEGEWWDELHPTSKAAKKLAAKFDTAIQASA